MNFSICCGTAVVNAANLVEGDTAMDIMTIEGPFLSFDFGNRDLPSSLDLVDSMVEHAALIDLRVDPVTIDTRAFMQLASAIGAIKADLTREHGKRAPEAVVADVQSHPTSTGLGVINNASQQTSIATPIEEITDEQPEQQAPVDPVGTSRSSRRQR